MRLLLTLAVIVSSLSIHTEDYQLNYGNPCIWQSTSDPPHLQGMKGKSDKDEYWFTHYSDVEIQTRKIHRFFHGILNNHSDNFLPIKWPKPKIEFSEILPYNCAAISYESSYSFKEDPNGIIKYGPILQFTKPAPFYTLYNDRGPLASGTRLTSRLFGNFRKDNSTYRIDVIFTTEVRDRDFIYTVINHSSADIYFSIPTILVGPTLGERFLTEWAKADNEYYISKAGAGPTTLTISYFGAGPMERQAEIIISTTKREELIRGPISVYKPLY